MRQDTRPTFEIVDTEYGQLIAARRDTDEDSYYWRISQFVLPWFTMFPPLIDEGIETLLQIDGESRQRGRGPIEIAGVHVGVEALQDAVIDDSLVAMVDLHLALRIVDVTHAEDVLEEELLRAFAEVLELRRRDALQRRGEALVRREVAVEDAVGA